MARRSPKRSTVRSYKRNSNLPFILIGLGVLLLLGVLIWQAISGRAPVASNPGGNIPLPDIERVSLADSKAALDQNQAIFLDVRDEASYNLSHIPGAVNIPLSEISSRASELDPNQWIITYCT